MARKPRKAVQYNLETTQACETLLITLLRAFGDFRDGLRLVGGLVPRYLAPAAPPEVPPHVGSNDVDVVLDLAMLGAGGVPADLIARLEAANFARYQNGQGGESRWQWERDIDGCWMRVDFLVNTDQPHGFAVVPIGDGGLCASAIPFAAIATTWFVERPITAELPDGGGGPATMTIRHVDATAFIALKALTLGRREEPKDVADLVHVMRYYPGAPDTLADIFAERLRGGLHGAALEAALEQLANKFCDDERTDGYLKAGPRGFGTFHDFANDDDRVLEQRNVSAMVTAFVNRVRRGAARGPGPGTLA